jgi:DNA-binding HxlR family transcriptional regulator
MKGKRRYEDGCATAHALELIGERWALLVLRELMLGPRRFTDLRAGLPGISPNVLSERLEELEAAALLRRRRLPPPASAWVYELTAWGAELEPLIRDIGRWAARSPTLRKGQKMSVNSVVLSLRTMFSAAAAGDLAARLGLVIAGQPFAVEIGNGGITVEPGAAVAPQAVLQGGPDDIAAVIYGGRDLDEAAASGALRADGDRELLRRFVSLFPLPAPAPGAEAHALG